MTYVENLKQLLLFGRFLYPKQDLSDVGARLVLLPNSDTYRVTDQPGSQLLRPGGDGGRRQKSLMFFWDLLKNLQNLLLEAHLQHSVHLQDAAQLSCCRTLRTDLNDEYFQKLSLCCLF